MHHAMALLDTTTHDVRYAARVLRKDPTFTLIAVVRLALGSGASPTVFGVVDTILLRPLPYRQPERIVFPWRLPPPTANVGFELIPWGRRELLAIAERHGAFEHVGAFHGDSFNLTGS